MINNIQLLFLFLIFNAVSYSQNILPSNTFIQACYNNTECYGISNSAQIFLNNNTGDFLIQMDFNGFRIGNDTLDDWLNDLSKSCFVFTGNIHAKELTGIINNNSQPVVVNGKIDFNGYSKPYNLEVVFFRQSREGTLISNSAQNPLDRIAISSMQIVFHAKDFHIGDRAHHFKKTIRITITRGYINEWTPEVNLLIKQ